MKLGWAHYVLPLKQGMARGYVNLRLNLYNQLKQLVELEDCVVTKNPESKMVLHVIPPHRFTPIDGAVNIVFSMWEAPTLLGTVADCIRSAEGYVVPSMFCKKAWLKAGLGKASVVPLGVDERYMMVDETRPLMFTAPYIKAMKRPRPMRFLYVGSGQARKGWHTLGNAWRMAFERTGANAQLYIKTIAQPGVTPMFQEFYKGGLVVDSRDLTLEGMAELYRSSDVFVFPSYGEGFGLPPLEAMAAGCLVIAPNRHGLAEFVSQNTAVVLRQSSEATLTYGGSWSEKVHTDKDVADAMKEVYVRWGEPIVQQRRRNGTALARRFTWSNSATRLVEVLRRDHGKKKARKNNSAEFLAERRKDATGSDPAGSMVPALPNARHISDEHQSIAGRQA